MLNINQNFDLKAPVFNFDRDYFNSVEELNAYDTSNVPDHFVTNVGGMLYQFTNGKWWPILGTTHNGSTIFVGGKNTSLNIGDQDRSTNFGPGYIDIYGSDQAQNGRLFIDTDTGEPNIELYDDRRGIFNFNTNGFRISNGSTSDSKEISLGINDTEALSDYGSLVNASLIDAEQNNIANINAIDGFRHIESDVHYSNLYYDGLDVNNELYSTNISAGQIYISNDDIDGNIEINTNKALTEEEQGHGYSPVDISLTDGDNKATINALSGFTYKAEDGYKAVLNSSGMRADVASDIGSIYARYQATSIEYHMNDDTYFAIGVNQDATDYALHSYIALGPDNNFKLSRPNNTEGGVISGIKSLTAFSNPSATKVWATDGSTVDVLLKVSDSGGYYIGSNRNQLGTGAFAVSSSCSAKGPYSHAEGSNTRANGLAAHAEGSVTNANGEYSHAEGSNTRANGLAAHAEGINTTAAGFAAHAEGFCNVTDINAIHSVGIGRYGRNKNAEYIYAKKDENSNKLADDPKNGYKYLIGVGGYDGISTDNTTYKSVQEVIADLTARIEQLETKVRALEAANTPA